MMEAVATKITCNSSLSDNFKMELCIAYDSQKLCFEIPFCSPCS